MIVEQRAIPLDLRPTAGSPLGVKITPSGATYSSPVVKMWRRSGALAEVGAPTVAMAGSDISIAWSGANWTDLMYGDTRDAQLLTWAVTALVNGLGPYPIAAGEINIAPEGTPGATTSMTLTTTLTIGTTTIPQTISIGDSIAGHLAAADPHPQYMTAAEDAAALAAYTWSKGEANSRYVSKSTVTSDRKRAVPPVWTLATHGLSVLTSSGLTTSSSKIAASSGGTDGSAIIPLWGPREDWRISFKLTATKATASSKSYIGLTVSALGVLPTGTGPTTAGTFGVGYLQGSGICMFRENVSTNTVLYADASITDGDVFDVELLSIPTQELAGGNTTPGIHATIRNAAGTIVYRNNAVTYNTAFYDPTNVIIRTNVAAGALGSVTVAQNPFGSVGLKESLSVVSFPTYASETVGIRLPATPNGRIVYHLHGHGATPSSIIDDATLKACYSALTDAGYTLVIPAMGGNLWGNTAALQSVVDLHTILTATYGLDEQACYLFGNSMGSGAACTLVSNGTLPVKAAYLAQPAVDYDGISANPSFSSINTAYPSTALRDASNPLKRAASTYAGVPLFITSSAADTAISKTTNADALNTLVSGVTTVRRITATGDHNDASHFRPGDMVQFFQAYQ